MPDTDYRVVIDGVIYRVPFNTTVGEGILEQFPGTKEKDGKLVQHMYPIDTQEKMDMINANKRNTNPKVDTSRINPNELD